MAIRSSINPVSQHSVQMKHQNALKKVSSCIRMIEVRFFLLNFYKNLFITCEFFAALNQITLLGRVGANPQLRGNETAPVVTFSLATHTNYK